jgi:hypothetical protein
VAVSPPAATGATPPCQRTFAGAPGIITGDGSPILSTVDVPEDGLVASDIDVAMNIHHPDASKLHIEFKALDDSDGVRANTLLFDQEQGVTGPNMLGTVFDDEGGVPITWGNAPYAGSFMPRRPLAEVEGLAGGKYLLLVAHLGLQTGTLDDWSVTLTYGACDFDGDGVEDHSDSCLQISARTTSGCPVTTRTLTAKYKLGKFKGALSSPVASCKAGRAVTIWKVRSGADRRVGTATTRSDGLYKLARAKRAGRYYATSPRAVVVGVAECPAVQSTTFRIR